MSSTVGARYAAGQVQATGAILYVHNVGFKPRAFRITNLTNSCQVEGSEALPVGTNLFRVAAGDLSVITSAPEVHTDANGNSGLKIPILAHINDTTTEMLMWEAWG